MWFITLLFVEQNSLQLPIGCKKTIMLAKGIKMDRICSTWQTRLYFATIILNYHLQKRL
jgi:hypothetical protein